MHQLRQRLYLVNKQDQKEINTDMDILGKSIKKMYLHQYDDEVASYDKAIIIVDGLDGMFFEVDTDYDEIVTKEFNVNLTELELNPNWISIEQVVGKKIVFIWDCKNQNGYRDLFVFALDNYQPSFYIVSVASQLVFHLIK